MASESDIIQYYVNQAGSGIGSIYSGPLYQKGYGIGSFLGGLFRACIPFLKKRGVAVGKELFKTGIEVLGDVQENETLRSSLRKRKADIYEKVRGAAITGNGYSKRQKMNIVQSSFENHPVKTIKKRAKGKKRNLKKDIFEN
jgi:hypothetical protein